MKSNTKSFLTRDQIISLVKSNFGGDCAIGRITELSGGMFNSAYLIERIKEKDKIVLKVSVAPGTRTLTYEQDLMPTEVEVYRLIQEYTTIPTPRVLAYDFSKRQIPSNYFFMSALEGQAMNKLSKKLTKENKDTIKLELAGYFAQLHKIKGDYFGYFSEDKELQFSSWKDAFFHMFKVLLVDAKQHKVHLPYERYENILKETAVYLEEVKESSLVDFDLWTGNLFLRKAGKYYVIEGIVDFERAFWGDPLADFSAAVLTIKNLHQEPLFWAEYQKKAQISHELTHGDDVRLALYSLYLFTIMATEVFRYGFIYGKLQSLYAKKLVMKYLKILEQIK